MILVTDTVKSLSDVIAIRSLDEADYFPIDRLFLNQFMEQILSFNEIEFLFYNIEKVNPTYVNLLFLCLPEIWEKISGSDLEFMIKNFTNHFSYFTIIEFTYKYIKVDIMLLLIECIKHDKDICLMVLNYLSNQRDVLVMAKEEEIDLKQGIGKEFFQYNHDQWLYIRQRLLLDDRIQFTLKSDLKIKKHINALHNIIFL